MHASFLFYLLYSQMADGGVVCRFRGNEMHCPECIRVTIGTSEDTEAFFEALDKTWKKVSSS